MLCFYANKGKKMKNVVVVGIGSENYNYKKIEGFVKGFSKLEYKVIHFRHINNSQLMSIGEIEILFSEDRNLPEDTRGIKTLITWTNYDLNKIVNYAIKNPNLNIILAPKSFMSNEEVNQKYIDSYGTSIYQAIDFEGQDIENIAEIFRSKPKVNETSVKVLKNLIVTYIPCTLSEIINSSEIKENKYKFSYFGTGSNRPNIVEIIKRLPGEVNFHFVEQGGPISPNDCIEMYKETEYVLHEQTNPVILEYPVRIGEANAAGCKIILIEKLPLYEKVLPTGKIPELIKFNSAEDFIQNLSYIKKRTIEERKLHASSFKHTYENTIKEFEFLIRQF